MEGPGKDPSWGIREPDSHSSPAIYCLRDLVYLTEQNKFIELIPLMSMEQLDCVSIF